MGHKPNRCLWDQARSGLPRLCCVLRCVSLCGKIVYVRLLHECCSDDRGVSDALKELFLDLLTIGHIKLDELAQG